MYHPALLVTYPIIVNCVPLLCNEFIYDFSQCNYNVIRSQLASIDWPVIFKDQCINSAVTNFYINIFKIIDINCTKKQVYNNIIKFPVWFSSILKDFIFKKKIAHKLYKLSPTQMNYNIFSNLRARCKLQSKMDYSKYITDTQNSLLSNPKQFWKFLKYKRSNNSLPTSMSYENQSISGGEEIVRSFAHYFSNVYVKSDTFTTTPDPSTFSPALTSDFNLFSVVLNTTDVLNELDTITYKSNPGPDMLPSIFFSNCKFVLTIPLLHLFNLSLSSGTFPTLWKTSFITPISKGGVRSNVTNYRPISLLSIIPKTFESIISKKITLLLSSLICDDQHGFISGKSTTTNHLIFHKYILDAFASRSQVDVIYTDFSKAFDKVNHSILISKLYNIGIQDPFLSWISSYISNREQIVKYKNFKSNPYYVTSGVPQGSHLAPLLFLLFINDLKFLNSRKLLFADDLKLFRQINSLNDSVLLQNDLNVLSDWCTINKLPLNIDKCKIISFTRSRDPLIVSYNINLSPLLRVCDISDLGVIFDSALTFNKHLLHTVMNSSMILGFITRNCIDFTNPVVFKTLYTSLVRAKLEYNTVVWSPYLNYQIQNLDNIQNRFLRFLAFKCNLFRLRHSPYEPLLHYFDIASLSERRKIYDMKFLFKLVNGYINSPEILGSLNFYVPQCRTRSTTMFYVFTHKTNYASASPINRIMSIANDLKIDLFNFNSIESFNNYVNRVFCI